MIDIAREFAKKFYNSRAWIKCRESYKAKVHGLCERCLKKGIYKSGDIVHHKTHLSPTNIDDPSITLDHSNLEYVCIECHNTEHMSKYSPTVEGISFNSNGEVVYTPPTNGE